MDYEIYNVQFVMNHAVIITTVPLDDDKEFDEEEVIKAGAEFLRWDGIDVSSAQEIIVERG